MTNLCFQPVLRGDNVNGSAVNPTLQVEAADCSAEPVNLWIDQVGVMVVDRHASPENAESIDGWPGLDQREAPARVSEISSPNGPPGLVRVLSPTGASLRSSPGHPKRASEYSLLATLVARTAATYSVPSWWLIPRMGLLALNGVRMLQLAALEPGDLLTAGRHRWFITSHWTPEPIAAPEAIASRECPACGGSLSLAPVIRCPCGRYYHLEKPEAPDDSNALNCYLTSRCSVCQREPSLEARYLPSAEEKLLV